MIITRSLYNFLRLQKYNIFLNLQFIFLEKSPELIIIDFNFQEKIGVLLLNKNNKTFKIPSNPYLTRYFKLIYYQIETNGILFKKCLIIEENHQLFIERRQVWIRH